VTIRFHSGLLTIFIVIFAAPGLVMAQIREAPPFGMTRDQENQAIAKPIKAVYKGVCDVLDIMARRADAKNSGVVKTVEEAVIANRANDNIANKLSDLAQGDAPKAPSGTGGGELKPKGKLYKLGVVSEGLDLVFKGAKVRKTWNEKGWASGSAMAVKELGKWAAGNYVGGAVATFIVVTSPELWIIAIPAAWAATTATEESIDLASSALGTAYDDYSKHLEGIRNSNKKTGGQNPIAYDPLSFLGIRTDVGFTLFPMGPDDKSIFFPDDATPEQIAGIFNKPTQVIESSPMPANLSGRWTGELVFTEIADTPGAASGSGDGMLSGLAMLFQRIRGNPFGLTFDITSRDFASGTALVTLTMPKVLGGQSQPPATFQVRVADNIFTATGKNGDMPFVLKGRLQFQRDVFQSWTIQGGTWYMGKSDGKQAAASGTWFLNGPRAQ